MKDEVRRRVMDHGGLVLYSQELHDVLWGDVAACEELLRQQDLPHVRRQLVRAAFALVEASTFYLKRIAFSAAKDGSDKLHRAVEAALLNEAYDVRPDGRVRVRGARIPTLANIRLSLNAIAASVAPGFEPRWGDAGWEAMRNSLKVRDRLMHPKSLIDLIVTDEELMSMRQTLEWYRKTLAGAFKIAADLHLARFNEIVARGGGQTTSAHDSPDGSQPPEV